MCCLAIRVWVQMTTLVRISVSQTSSAVILGQLHTSGKHLRAPLHVKCTLHIQSRHLGVAHVPGRRCYSKAFCAEG